MYEAGVDIDDVEAVESVLVRLCGALDPDAIPLTDVPVMYGSLVRMRKLVVGAETRLARRLEESQAWIGQGDPSAADWIARMSGCSKNAAKDRLNKSERLKDLPETDDAGATVNCPMCRHQSSPTPPRQTPSAESKLLGASKTKGLGELRDECQRTKANADPNPDATYDRIHRARRLRRWSDAEGGYNLSLRTTSDVGGKLDASLQPVIDRLFDSARRDGVREPVEAYAADALIELATTGAGDDNESSGRRRPSRAQESKIIALIDHRALCRGHVEGTETCEIAGVGPVPVSTVHAMMADAFLAAVVTDGTDVYRTTTGPAVERANPVRPQAA